MTQAQDYIAMVQNQPDTSGGPRVVFRRGTSAHLTFPDGSYARFAAGEWRAGMYVNDDGRATV